MPQTIEECDAAIIEAHVDMLRAEHEYDLAAASLAYARRDELLEHRLRIPQQRQP